MEQKEQEMLKEGLKESKGLNFQMDFLSKMVLKASSGLSGLR